MAHRFLEAIKKTIDILLDFPHIGTIWISDYKKLRGVRWHPVRKFKNYLVFYRATEKTLEVLHFYRTSQDINKHLD